MQIILVTERVITNLIKTGNPLPAISPGIKRIKGT